MSLVRKSRRLWYQLAIIGVASLALQVGAQPDLASKEEKIASLLLNAQPVPVLAAASTQTDKRPAEPVRVERTEDGYLKYLGAPPGHHLPFAGAIFGKPDETARNFLRDQKALFGATSSAIDFAHLKTNVRANRSNVRFRQTYAGLPVFAAEMMVQVSSLGGIEAVFSSMARDVKDLDEKRLSIKPDISAEDASARVRSSLVRTLGAIDLTITPPRLTIFVPAVMHESGPIQLVWDMEVSSESGLESANVRILLDAHSGEVARRYSLLYHAVNRQVSDANGTSNTPGTLVRSEGQGPCGIADADNAYQFLGDTYNFYLSHHGRDGIDGLGGALNSTVRYCSPNPSPSPPTCPMAGTASYSGGRMYFGAGNVADDVTGHELTHGVTAVESGLIYANASGAINESFSDVWGEFIDLTNGSVNDTAANRWLIGEELPGGAIRSMKTPPAYAHPDRLNSPLYVPAVVNPTGGQGGNDFGGVHTNSGVNNKLCYLLTDGDTFNGQTTRGLGITNVAALYYEVQTNILGPSANWGDLYLALRQAAVTLGWNPPDRNNVYRGCVAVEIGSAGRDLYVNKTSTCLYPVGYSSCGPFGDFGPYVTVAQGVGGLVPGDVLHIRSGTYHESVTIETIATISAEGGSVTIGQ